VHQLPEAVGFFQVVVNGPKEVGNLLADHHSFIFSKMTFLIASLEILLMPKT
jgi:hypothetical protein